MAKKLTSKKTSVVLVVTEAERFSELVSRIVENLCDLWNDFGAENNDHEVAPIDDMKHALSELAETLSFDVSDVENFKPQKLAIDRKPMLIMADRLVTQSKSIDYTDSIDITLFYWAVLGYVKQVDARNN
jgi:predicted phage-related endonuclease